MVFTHAGQFTEETNTRAAGGELNIGTVLHSNGFTPAGQFTAEKT